MQPAQSQNGSNPSTFRRARLQPLKFSLCGEHARLQSFKFSVCGEFETITILQIFRECSKRLQSFKISACGVLKTNTILSKRLQPLFFFRQRRAQNNYTPVLQIFNLRRTKKTVFQNLPHIRLETILTLQHSRLLTHIDRSFMMVRHPRHDKTFVKKS